MHIYPTHLLTVLISYLVKLWSTYLCLHCVLKSGPFTVCSKFARCHLNLIIFSRHMPEEFCNETFTSLSPPNLALHVAPVLYKAATIWEHAKHKFLAKLNNKISQKEKLAAQSKCSKCCPSALTQVCSRPCHSLMVLSTTRSSRPDHAAIRRCIICYWATFKLVLDYRKCCLLYTSDAADE